MKFQFGFENLDVWQEAKGLAHSIYKLTADIDGKYSAAIKQLQRSALSISLNIAEGAGRGSKADFARFLSISLGSTNETVAVLRFLADEKQIDDEKFMIHYEWSAKIARMISALKNSFNKQK